MICVTDEVISEKKWHGSFVIIGSGLTSKWRKVQGERHKDETAFISLITFYA